MTEKSREVLLLELRIEESGLSVRQFANEVLLREERKIRKWIDGDSPIPALVVDWLANPRPRPWPKKSK